MMSHPLEATLAQLSQASRFTLTLGAPEGEGWFCPAELTDADHPAYAQIAARLAAARFADAAQAGARLLLTEDPACLRLLRANAPAEAEVVGLYETLAAAIVVR